MYLLSLGYQGVTGQCIGVLAADQGADSSNLCVMDIERRTVTK